MKATIRTADMHVGGESDGLIVPTQRANNVDKPMTEPVDGRGPTKRNVDLPVTCRTQSRIAFDCLYRRTAGLYLHVTIRVLVVDWKDAKQTLLATNFAVFVSFFRIARIKFNHSVDFKSFALGNHGLGSKQRFHPPDFNEFDPN